MSGINWDAVPQGIYYPDPHSVRVHELSQKVLTLNDVVRASGDWYPSTDLNLETAYALKKYMQNHDKQGVETMEAWCL